MRGGLRARSLSVRRRRRRRRRRRKVYSRLTQRTRQVGTEERGEGIVKANAIVVVLGHRRCVYCRDCAG